MRFGPKLVVADGSKNHPIEKKSGSSMMMASFGGIGSLIGEIKKLAESGVIDKAIEIADSIQARDIVDRVMTIVENLEATVARLKRIEQLLLQLNGQSSEGDRSVIRSGSCIVTGSNANAGHGESHSDAGETGEGDPVVEFEEPALA